MPVTAADADAAYPILHSGRCAYAAIVFDMDGVVTETALVHAAAWKKLFDEVLPKLGPNGGSPFDQTDDYRRYVDGRSREDGIRTFLASRNITLPEGTVGDPDDQLTVRALAARKQHFFDLVIAKDGVTAFPDAVRLLRHLQRRGVPTAVVTSSRNCVAVLAAAGVKDLFSVRVDGNDAIRLHLPGKPDPAVFLEAARQLGVTPASAAMVEDATAGVQAGAAGGFGLVVGMDRDGAGERLRAAGADVVVSDLGELDLSRERQLTAAGASPGSLVDPWVLKYDSFDPATEADRETLCTLSNAYWGTRGAAAEASADDVHYPGTYFAGVFNRVTTDFGTRTDDDEHLVNAPNWLPLRLRVPGGAWLKPCTAEILSYSQELDLKAAVLTREVRYRHDGDKVTVVTSRRFISLASPHIAVLQTTIEAENWSGAFLVQSALDGAVSNMNVDEDQLLAHVHLVSSRAEATGPDTVLMQVMTTQSEIRIALVQRTRVLGGEEQLESGRRLITNGDTWIGHEFDVQVSPGHPIRVDKTVVAVTSHDRAVEAPAEAAQRWMDRTPNPAELEDEHRKKWQTLWDDFAVEIESNSPARSLALNVNTFHVLQTVAAGRADADAGIPARGLSGEGYRGHIFWDEIFVYPIVTLRRPDISRSVTGYRYRRLEEARAAARANGHSGAMFPWQSGMDGRELTPTELFNPRNQSWMPDNSHLEHHAGLAVAYSAWQLYEATGDTDFLVREGAELIVEVARFFVSIAVYNLADDRYDIDGVMGPDEFHDGNPGSPGSGIRNNAYTNVMTAWLLQRALQTITILRGRDCGPLWDQLNLVAGETRLWARISRKLRVVFHADGVISQFEGYEALSEFDWDTYRARYGNLGRLDLILNAEGLNTNDYRLSKQADVLMLLYLFSAEELRGIFADLGYTLPARTIVRTVDFYIARSTRGSTLSNVVESWVEARRDRTRSWELLGSALTSDLTGGHQGTTHEGIHLGAMAGSVDMAIRCYAGLEIRGDTLWLHPALPVELHRVAFVLVYREQRIRVELTRDRLSVRVDAGRRRRIQLDIDGQHKTLSSGQRFVVALSGESDM
jgi:beta-phosphoglucomutase family hydrolase